MCTLFALVRSLARSLCRISTCRSHFQCGKRNPESDSGDVPKVREQTHKVNVKRKEDEKNAGREN